MHLGTAACSALQFIYQCSFFGAVDGSTEISAEAQTQQMQLDNKTPENEQLLAKLRR